MNGTGRLEERIFALMEPSVIERGLELVEVEFQKEHGGWVLRLVIDKPGGVTLDDCASVSQAAGDLLESDDPISQSYRLEVTSPGIDRVLKTKKDFIRFTGEWVEVHLYAPIDGKKVLIGELIAADDQEISIRPEKEDIVRVDRSKVAKVNLHIRF